MLILFYAAALSQIFLISYYYPKKFSGRITQVLAKYPPASYPKLYPRPYDDYAEDNAKPRLRVYLLVNVIIALIGLAGLAALALSDFTLNPLGGAEIFVVLYFFLQFVPHAFIAVLSANYYRQMKRENPNIRRKAELIPRRLFDFISPVYLFLAVVLFFGYLAFYIYDQGLDGAWRENVYVTLIGISAINLMFVATIFKYVNGVRIDPHQANKDRLKAIRMVVHMSVLASIMMNIFLIMSAVVDRYGWEIIDPILTSIYFQMVMAFGMGLVFRRTKTEDMDFDVYKEDAPAP